MGASHKTIICTICDKPMRSNNLKQHKQIRKDLLSLPDDEIKNELKSRQEIKKKKEEKIQKVVEIAKENNLAIPKEIKRESTEDNYYKIINST